MKCHICKNEVTRYLSPMEIERNKHFFCSRPCYVIFWANEKKGSKNVNWVGGDTIKKCIICEKEFGVRGYRRNTAQFCSIRCHAKYKFSGEKNNRWTGGVPREKRDQLLEYREWRNAVYKRDWYTCKLCGDKPKRIVAHHIKVWKHFPALRFEVDNGITLCRPCHAMLHGKYPTCKDFTKILNDYTLGSVVKQR